MKLIAKSAVLLAIIAALISFIKFDYCRSNGWTPPGDYIHACYSDFPALFGDRGLITNSWPYSSATNAVEYPPITGLIMWVTSFLVGDGEDKFVNYFGYPLIRVYIYWIKYYKAIPLNTKKNH